MHVLDRQFEELRRRHPRASLTLQANGTSVVTVPGMPLPEGWNVPTTDVAFVVPTGFPQASPDCFWTTAELRLRNGGPPQNTGLQAVPGIPSNWLWFSWHPATWSPNVDSLSTYLYVIRQRLGEVR